MNTTNVTNPNSAKERDLLKGVGAWTCDMQDRVEKCVERFCGLAKQSFFSLRQVAKPCVNDHYHAGPNQFRTISGFLELISRFEFDFLRREIFFFNDSNFWCVQSSITHNVAVHVPVLWPVCAHKIPFQCCGVRDDS